MNHRPMPTFRGAFKRGAAVVFGALLLLLLAALLLQSALAPVVVAQDLGASDVQVAAYRSQAALTMLRLNAPQDEIDFGDAPDPTYHTLAANNGARHMILPGFSLGPTIDADPDGQPDVAALGDDNDGSDDEDGIAFLTAFLPGVTACIDATLNNGAAISDPRLDGWIDYNGDGMWDAAEHLWGGVSQPLVSGSNILCFMVPAGASRGHSYARFRLSKGGGLPPVGPGSFGEVEDYTVYIEFTKWEQPPTKLHPQDACFWGWDEASIYGDQNLPIIADDWLCQDFRPVTDIHWWGSYQGWDEQEPPSQSKPVAFHIGVWTDMPAPPGSFSHPDKLIKEWTVAMTKLNERPAGCDYYTGMPAPDTCFRYDFEIPQEEWFFQNPETDNVYWLSISAIYPGGPPQQYKWGWLTRRPEWNDDAVRIFDPIAPTTGVSYISGEPIETQEEGSWDTSFVLTSLPTEFQSPHLRIEITNTVDAKLLWQHITTDVVGNPITINRYYIYRDTSPYQAPTATQLTILDGPFSPGDVMKIIGGDVGDASQNHYYYVRAAVTNKYGVDALSDFSNHVGEFDFTLVPGS